MIGINTAIAATGQGIGFAIPINMAKDLLPQLREFGSVTRGWLGVQIQRVDPTLARSFGLDKPEGALVSQVFDDSPAQKADLEQGDVILEFAGEKIRDYDDLPRRVAATKPGSEVGVVVLREGKRKNLTAVLETMQDADTEPAVQRESTGSDWGFEAAELTNERAERFGLDSEGAGRVVVTTVDVDGPAAEAGLREGDVIREANRAKIRSPEDLKAALGEDDEVAVLLIQRGDGRLYLPLKKN